MSLVILPWQLPRTSQTAAVVLLALDRKHVGSDRLIREPFGNLSLARLKVASR
jgi:hypothetical protein